MKKLMLAVCLMSSFTFSSVVLAGEAQAKTASTTPLLANGCSADNPYRYRIALNYIGSKASSHETGSSVMIGCLPREIKSEADWNWLQHKIETNPKITKVSIMSAVLLSN